MSKKIVFLCLVAMLIVASCHKAPQSMQIFTEEYPPISFAVGDSISGYATEVVRAMQAKLENKDTITLTDWNTAYEKALNQKNVILFSMEQTPQRKELFNWIGPLGDNAANFYIRKDSKLKIGSLEDGKNLKQIATTSAWFTEQYLRDNGFSNLASFSQPVENIKQVMEGKSDATILTDLTAKEIIKTAGYNEDDLIPVFEVMRTQYYIAVSKQTDTEVFRTWEAAFKELTTDGTIEKIRSKWFK